MGWLLPVGVVLVVVGLGGTATACYETSRDVAAQSTPASPAAGPDGGVPAAKGDDSNRTLILGSLAGLSLATGAGCIAVGMGRWTRPVPSTTRPANPYSEQPRDKGEPPVGLV